MRDTLSKAILACCASALIGGCASSRNQPSAESGAGLRSLIAAERAFARRAESSGIKDAFVANLGVDGLLFRPGPVNGLAWFRDRPPARGYLSWDPEWAEISASGELGWTTGPFEFRAAGASDTVSNAGHYVTVWRRDSNGAWKMAVDIGTSHRFVAKPNDAGGAVMRRASSLGGDAQRRLLAQDSVLGSAAVKVHNALLSSLDRDARLHREGAIPALGEAAVRVALRDDDRVYRSKPLGGGTSRTADFGYTYGEYDLAATSERSAERGFYLRLWRPGSDGTWRVILDLAQPAP
jgi:uncharacterized protein DUF4440